MIRLGGTAIAAILAWAVLLTGVPAGVAWLCDADGPVSSVVPWDAGRLGTLTATWAVMMAAMVLPCVAVSIALSAWPHPHTGVAHLLPSREKGQRTGIAVPLPSPLMGEGVRRADEGGAAMTLVSFLCLTLAAALLHWSLESAGLLGSAEVTAILLASVLLLALRKWSGPANPILAPIQMVCLQLLVDPMSVGWMAVVLLWMLADLLLPRRATILSATRSFEHRPIVPLRAFD